MIRSSADLVGYVRADLRRYGPGRLAWRLARHPQLRFLIRLRVTEWVHNTRRGPAGRCLDPLLRWRLQTAGRRLGYTIPVNCFGPGLKLPHWGTIVISGEATIGADCTCHPGVLVGTRGGAPTVGDGVYLGSGAKLYGPLTVGSGAVIAPNAVVTRDVPAGAVVGGVPARPLSTALVPAARTAAEA